MNTFWKVTVARSCLQRASRLWEQMQWSQNIRTCIPTCTSLLARPTQINRTPARITIAKPKSSTVPWLLLSNKEKVPLLENSTCKNEETKCANYSCFWIWDQPQQTPILSTKLKGKVIISFLNTDKPWRFFPPLLLGFFPLQPRAILLVCLPSLQRSIASVADRPKHYLIDRLSVAVR